MTNEEKKTRAEWAKVIEQEKELITREEYEAEIATKGRIGASILQPTPNKIDPAGPWSCCCGGVKAAGISGYLHYPSCPQFRGLAR